MTNPRKLVDIEKHTMVTTMTRHTARLNRADLLALIRNAGVEIPDNATFYFQTPGGGNWSNVSIDIDDENPVNIIWTVETQDEK